MSRIRHATETFVNHLIDGVKKLIASNTEQINVLEQGKVDKIMFKPQAEKIYLIGSIKKSTSNHHRQTLILSGGGETGHQTFHIEIHSVQGGNELRITPTRIDGKKSSEDASIMQFYYKDNGSVFDVFIKTTTWTAYVIYSIIPLNKGSMTFVTPTISSLTEADLARVDIIELATTTKTDISLTPKAGFKINNNYSHLINNVVYIDVFVSKTDLTAFGTNQVAPFDIPTNLKRENPLALGATPWVNTSMRRNNTNACIYGATCYFVTDSTDASVMHLYGSYTI